MFLLSFYGLLSWNIFLFNIIAYRRRVEQRPQRNVTAPHLPADVGYRVGPDLQETRGRRSHGRVTVPVRARASGRRHDHRARGGLLHKLHDADWRYGTVCIWTNQVGNGDQGKLVSQEHKSGLICNK